MSAARYTGVVSHLDEATGFAEISVTGMQPVMAEFAALKRIGADKLGVVVDFSHGVLVGKNEISGAVDITRPTGLAK